MTEAEWLACADPTPMLDYLEGKANERKLRLFAVACCRRFWNILFDARSRKALLLAEAYADGLVSKSDLGTGEREACEAASVTGLPDMDNRQIAVSLAAWEAVNLVEMDLSHDWVTSRSRMAESVHSQYEIPSNHDTDAMRRVKRREFFTQSFLLRDIFGNPFRPVAIDPSWLTSDVLALANGIYEERAFDRMPILADALQDAGCNNDDILNHCRQPGEHVRGCWVVDLLLGKS